MKLAVLFIALLAISTVAAEIVIKEQEKVYENPLFDIDTSNGLKVTANYDFEQPTFFIDGEEVLNLPSMEEGSIAPIPAEPGTHEFEMRALVDLEYGWDNFKLTKDDAPIRWAYLNYNQDKGQITFALNGADIIHPQDLKRTGKSYNERFDEYDAILNNAYKLNCYPKITTEKNMGFSCGTRAYPKTLDLTLTLGVMEVHEVDVSERIIENIGGAATQTPPSQQAEPEQNNDEEITNDSETYNQADNIVMHDNIPEQQTVPGGVITIIIVLFITVIYFLFIASHHKHENRKAGKLHPDKKNKPREHEQEQLPRYAPSPADKPPRTQR